MFRNTENEEEQDNPNYTATDLGLRQGYQGRRLRAKPEALYSGTQQSLNSGVICQSDPPNSEEYKFWLCFFDIVGPGLEKEFIKRVSLEGPFISWSFWVDNKDDKKEEYRDVLRKATLLMKDQYREWKVDSIKQLLPLAQNVRNKRREKLKNNNTQTDKAHLEIFHLWDKLSQAIDDLLVRLRTRTVTRVEPDMGIGFNHGRNSIQSNENNEGLGLGGLLVGLGALAVGGAYLAYKVFGDSENEIEQESNARQNGRPNAAVIHRGNQCNPNHKPTGPGRPSGYRGLGTKEDLDNHSNQINPNNSRYQGPR